MLIVRKNIAYLFVLQKGTVQLIVLSNIVPYIKGFPIGYLIVNHLSNYDFFCLSFQHIHILHPFQLLSCLIRSWIFL